MSDADDFGRPFYDPRYVGKPAKPRLGERLWTLRKDGHDLAAELRYWHELGVEGQILRDGDLLVGWRFALRAMAVEWLEAERGDLERQGWRASQPPSD